MAEHERLTDAERDALESMVDSKSLWAIADALEIICDQKARDADEAGKKELGRQWSRASRRLFLVCEEAKELNQ